MLTPYISELLDVYALGQPTYDIYEIKKLIFFSPDLMEPTYTSRTMPTIKQFIYTISTQIMILISRSCLPFKKFSFQVLLFELSLLDYSLRYFCCLLAQKSCHWWKRCSLSRLCCSRNLMVQTGRDRSWVDVHTSCTSLYIANKIVRMLIKIFV